MKLKIDHKFPSLNDYIAAERTNKYKASKMKKDLTEIVALECKRQKIPKYGWEQVKGFTHEFEIGADYGVKLKSRRHRNESKHRN